MAVKDEVLLNGALDEELRATAVVTSLIPKELTLEKVEVVEFVAELVLEVRDEEVVVEEVVETLDELRLVDVEIAELVFVKMTDEIEEVVIEDTDVEDELVDVALDVVMLPEADDEVLTELDEVKVVLELLLVPKIRKAPTAAAATIITTTTIATICAIALLIFLVCRDPPREELRQ